MKKNSGLTTKKSRHTKKIKHAFTPTQRSELEFTWPTGIGYLRRHSFRYLLGKITQQIPEHYHRLSTM